MLGLPRGGLPVALEVARELHAALDSIVVRKLGLPFQPEYAFGALGEDGVRVIDADVVRQAQLTEAQRREVEAHERSQLERRVRKLRGDHPPVPLAGRTVIIVDDGVATGSTARAACLVARARGASRVILAVPVGSMHALTALRQNTDKIVCLHTVARPFAVGECYADFSQVSDDQVAIPLSQAAAFLAGPDNGSPDPTSSHSGRSAPTSPSGAGHTAHACDAGGGKSPRRPIAAAAEVSP